MVQNISKKITSLQFFLLYFEGTVYISKKAFMFMFNLLKAFQIYFVSRFFVGRNLQKICGGTWAGWI